MIASSCQEKTKGQNAAETKKNVLTKQDSLHKPKVTINVNRKYDDKGNMIGFDSTYSSYYSNMEGDTVKMDSLMQRFNRYFDQNSFLRNELNPLFFNDSTRYPDFFHHDFFEQRYEMNDPYLKRMMHRMDSIKNHFYLGERNENKKQKKTP